MSLQKSESKRRGKLETPDDSRPCVVVRLPREVGVEVRLPGTSVESHGGLFLTDPSFKHL